MTLMVFLIILAIVLWVALSLRGLWRERQEYNAYKHDFRRHLHDQVDEVSRYFSDDLQIGGKG